MTVIDSPPRETVGRRRATAPERPPMDPWVAGTVWILTAIAGVGLFVVLYALVFSAFQEHSAQHRLYTELRYNLSQETTPFGGAIPAGTPIAAITIPHAGLARTVVVEGTSALNLRSGPGHRPDTALPGQPGVSVLFGRSVTFGAPFRHVAGLQKGAVIDVVTGQGSFKYQVIDVRRAGDPFPSPLAGGASRLTLETSTAGGWRSGWAPSGTVYVDANLQGSPVAAPAGRVTQIPADDLPMSGDKRSLLPLVFWLQGLVLVGLSVVWMAIRYGSWRAWALGAAPILALLWGATGSALGLLPNLI